MPGRKTVLVVEAEGRPIGMCFAGLRDDDPATGYFAGMHVSSSVRRRGYGARLLRAAEAWIRRHGGRRIRTGVAAPNNVAIDFYRSCGYTISGEMRKLREGSDVPVHIIEKQFPA